MVSSEQRATSFLARLFRPRRVQQSAETPVVVASEPVSLPGAFVVSTGRCGSTLLSQMLATHPTVLSISEFFTGLGMRAFEVKHLNGAEFWEIICSPRPAIEMLLQQDMQLPEVLRDLSAGESGAAQVPAILMTTLPQLSNDPQSVFADMEREVPTWPYDTIGAQYSRLFGWLSERFGKTSWVERSGDSLRFVPQLLRSWPDAKFVHLYRDGRETALSMSRHNYFRVQLAAGLLERQSPGATKVAGWLNASTLTTIQATDMPVEQFGLLWSRKIEQGVRGLAMLAPGKLLNLRYEDLVADPGATIERLIEFLDLTDSTSSDWIESAGKLVTPRELAWKRLPEDEQQRLEQACAKGMQLLGYV